MLRMHSMYVCLSEEMHFNGSGCRGVWLSESGYGILC